MCGTSQCRTSNVVRDGIGHIATRVAHQLSTDRQIQVVKVSKEVFIQALDFVKNRAPEQGTGTAAGQDPTCLLELAIVHIAMTEPICSSPQKQCISSSVQIAFLGHAQ